MFNNIIVLILPAIFSATTSDSECPDLTAANLDTEFEFGIWYEYGRYPNRVERAHSNIAFNILPKPNGYVAETVGIPRDSPDYLTVEGTYVPNQVPNGVANFTMSRVASNISVHLIIKYIGYDKTFFVAYGCLYDPEKRKKEELAWLYGRTPTMTIDVQRKLNNTIEMNKLDYERFNWTDNTNLHISL